MDTSGADAGDLSGLLADVLESCPDPLFVVDAHGIVERVNAPAQAIQSKLGLEGDGGATIASVLLRLRILGDDTAEDPFDTRRIGDLTTLVLNEDLPAEPIYDLRVRARTPSNGELSGHIVQLIVVNPLLAVMRGRETARRHRDGILGLLSHDLRSPHAAILATLNHPDLATIPANLRQIIERAARRSLNMVDSLVRSVRAETADYDFQEVDLAHVLEEVVDLLWSRAHENKIRIELEEGSGEYFVCADRPMLCRALKDVLSGFIAFGVAGQSVQCRLRITELDGEPAVSCEVTGSARQISDGELARIFSRFAASQTSDVGSLGDNDGLRLVRTVVQRHGGWVASADLPSARRAVTVILPAVQPPTHTGSEDGSEGSWERRIATLP